MFEAHLVGCTHDEENLEKPLQILRTSSAAPNGKYSIAEVLGRIYEAHPELGRKE